MSIAPLSKEFVEFLEQNRQIWICPRCGHGQSKGLNWCGKNLTCQGCNGYFYYKEWSTK